MRFLYNLLTYLLLLPFAAYWLVRGAGNRRYLDRLGQRFGFGFPRLNDCIWVHAVSVGEVQASASLVRAMQEHHYVLQYHLYLVALCRFLRSRVPGFDYDRDIGGVRYLFLRGLGGSEGDGWFADRPPRERIAELDRCLGGSR